MTLEEALAEITKLKESQEALAAKNRELLTEVKTFKAKAKGAEIDPGEFEQLKSELEETRNLLAKTEKASKAELEKLQGSLKNKDQALKTYLLDGGLSDALAKVGVKPEYMDATKALLRQQAAIKEDGENYLAVMGDKPIFDAVKEWASSDTGKHFVAASANSGGGSQGGDNKGGSANKGDLGGDKAARLAAIEARLSSASNF